MKRFEGEHDDRRGHRRRQLVDDEEQLVEGQRGHEDGRRGEHLIAPLAGEDGADQGGGEEVAEVARGAAEGRDLEEVRAIEGWEWNDPVAIPQSLRRFVLVGMPEAASAEPSS